MIRIIRLFVIFLILFVAFDVILANELSSLLQNIKDKTISEEKIDQNIQYGEGFMTSYKKAQTNGFLFLLYLFINITSLLAAIIHNFIHIIKHKKASSFVYGYFVSYYSFQCFVIPLTNAIGPSASALSLLVTFLFCVVIGWIPGYFCFKRNFSGFIIGSLTSFNPIIYVSSLIYSIFCYKKFSDFRTPPPLPSIQSPDPIFILHDGEKQYEPMAKSRIRELFQNHEVNETFFFWDEKSQEWRTIMEVIE